MDLELYAILSTVAPTYHFIIDGQPPVAIVYRLSTVVEHSNENGIALSETYYYGITINMTSYSEDVVNNVKSAVCAGGYRVVGQEQDYDAGLNYYQYLITLSKWRVKNEHIGT